MPRLKNFDIGVVTPNEIVSERKLTWTAKGIWTYLSSLPEGADMPSPEEIASNSTDDVNTILLGLEELKANKLLIFIEGDWFLQNKAQ